MRRMIGAAGQSPVKTAALHPGLPFLPGTSEQTQEKSGQNTVRRSFRLRNGFYSAIAAETTFDASRPGRIIPPGLFF